MKTPNTSSTYTVKVYRTYEVCIQVEAADAQDAQEIVEWSTPEIEELIFDAMADPHTILEQQITTLTK